MGSIQSNNFCLKFVWNSSKPFTNCSIYISKHFWIIGGRRRRDQRSISYRWKMRWNHWNLQGEKWRRNLQESKNLKRSRLKPSSSVYLAAYLCHTNYLNMLAKCDMYIVYFTCNFQCVIYACLLVNVKNVNNFIVKWIITSCVMYLCFWVERSLPTRSVIYLSF